ncbi:TIGR01459 family HAD-type hydrolase, partial [Mesorhizobium sp. M7A.F.Ca.CA.002.15.1.1]
MSAKTIERLDGLGPLAERYNVFLLDQFGVLHDGTRPYPGAAAALSALKRAGKTVVLVSNSGRRAQPNESRLMKLGFEPGSWDHF